jgi:hypothetical protein
MSAMAVQALLSRHSIMIIKGLSVESEQPEDQFGLGARSPRPAACPARAAAAPGQAAAAADSGGSPICQ